MKQLWRGSGRGRQCVMRAEHMTLPKHVSSLIVVQVHRTESVVFGSLSPTWRFRCLSGAKQLQRRSSNISGAAHECGPSRGP